MHAHKTFLPFSFGFCVFAGCGPDEPVAPPGTEPVVMEVSIAANELNNLSTIVGFRASHVDSARVAYWTDGATWRTPYVPVDTGSNHIPTLGLSPNTTYSHVVEAKGSGGAVASESIAFTTGPLPDVLANDVHFEVVVPRKATSRAPGVGGVARQ